MNWNKMFAARTEQMKRTAVRELLKVAARPEIISFAGGLPAAELFPLTRVSDAVARVFQRFGGSSLQYGETEGLAGLREWLAGEFTKQPGGSRGRGVRAPSVIRPENILITSGAQQALDLIGRVLLDEGDCVAVENPTYLALLSAWRPHAVKFLPVRSDEQGMRVETLDASFGHLPKLIYLTPNFQNPQGTTLTLDRRKQLLQLATRCGSAIVEDNPYGDLRYSGEDLPHLLTLNAGAGRRDGGSSSGSGPVIYVGSFSKVLMPGLRVGWIIADRELIEKLVQAKQAADLQTNSLGQHIVLELLTSGFLREFLPQLKQNYQQRRDAMLNALDRFFPGDASWSRPDGGMFLMARLPSVDATVLLPEALKQGVAYVPGEEFHLNGEGKNTMRLNFSNASPERIEIGIKRLSALLSKTCKHPAASRDGSRFLRSNGRLPRLTPQV
jgi:2-aminoadipate transaminase